MAGRGRNEGFRFIDDFVCEAIPAPIGAEPQTRSTRLKKAEPAENGAGPEHPLVSEFVNGVLIIRASRRMLDESEERQVLAIAAESAKKTVLLNLSGVGFVSASFVASVLEIHERLQSIGGNVKTCNLSKPIFDLFSLCNLDRVLTIFQSEQDALGSE